MQWVDLIITLGWRISGRSMSVKYSGGALAHSLVSAFTTSTGVDTGLFVGQTHIPTTAQATAIEQQYTL